MRFVLLLLGAMLIWALDPSELIAQTSGGTWPPGISFARGPGFYLNLWKLGICWSIFAFWVHSTDWVNQDCLTYRLNYALWNSVVFFTFVTAFILVWLIPLFWLSLVLLLVAYVTPLVVFVWQRNQQVEYADKVFNKAHLRRWFSAKAALVGLKIAAEPPDIDAVGPPVRFKAIAAANERDNNINLLTARQHAGYLPARELIHRAIENRAESILLEYGAQLVAVRYQVDGFWHNQEPLDRLQVGDPLLFVVKTIAALNPNDRRSKQVGMLGIEVSNIKYQSKLATQGTQSGEKVVLQFEGQKLAFQTLEEIGMRPKMVEQFASLLSEKQGIILISAMPAGGLSTTFDVVLNSTDRFMRNFAAVESVTSTERDVLNIPITTYDPSTGESPATVLPKLIRTYPEVLVVRNLVNLETLEILVHQATTEGRLVLTTVRAKDAAEALLRVLTLKIPPADFANAALASLNVRLVRKLCEKCKEAYPPPSEVLKQMGLPPGRIESFYRTPTKPINPKHPDEVCDQCQGIGYFGRTAICELMMVDDSIREVLANRPKLDLLRDAARKAKHRTLQDEGLLLVARGVTSLQELLRVLKQ